MKVKKRKEEDVVCDKASPKTENAACSHHYMAQKRYKKGNALCTFAGKNSAKCKAGVTAVVLLQLFICQKCDAEEYFPVHLDHIYSDSAKVEIIEMVPTE